MDVLFHRLARQEYHSARRWYRRHGESVESGFIQAIDDVVVRIRSNPKLGTRIKRNIRGMKAKRYPYLLYYEKLNEHQIEVYAVSHSRRRPEYWVRRRDRA